MMDMFHVVACVLLSYGLAAPVAELDVDKRRESTPEILGLEKQLKKAAGENKQYFSNPNSRPMPQIDGLDANNEQLQNSVADKEMPIPDQPTNDDTQNDVMDDIEDGYDVDDDSQRESYLSMWKLFKQHPEYMEQMYQDYLANPEGRVMGLNEIEADDNPEYENVKRASEVGVFAYPSENELLVGGAPYQGKQYVPSDEGDRTAALMADYAAAAGARYPFSPQSEEDLYDTSDDVEGEEEQEQADQEHDDEEQQSEEDEEELESLESQQGENNPSEDMDEDEEEKELDETSNSKMVDDNAVPPVM